GWTGVAVGDPAEDIASLALAVGSPAAVRAATLAGYAARPCLRGLWLARCDAVLHCAEALTGSAAEPPPALTDRLRRAWEPILLERVTELREDVTEGPEFPTGNSGDSAQALKTDGPDTGGPDTGGSDQAGTAPGPRTP
ncbi:hypothetical protein NGM37_46745, partial [Streptomyces sp. TRM76130]|nr:hypothetical protein [Streptomyces sp. TRM76130]